MYHFEKKRVETLLTIRGPGKLDIEMINTNIFLEKLINFN